MINSEMLPKFESDELSSVSDMAFITNALEENDKLKAEIEQLRYMVADIRTEMFSKEVVLALKKEIEQLKAELEQWQSTNLKLVCELTRIECENNQLKSELEQSVKLPCKLKDIVYEVVKCDNGEIRIFEMKVCNVCEYGSFHNGNKEKFIWNIYMEDEKGFGYSYGTFYDFGKTIFLTREEAEQSLKGQVQ